MKCYRIVLILSSFLIYNCTKTQNTGVLLELDFNLGFEKAWSNTVIPPWKFYHLKSMPIDSVSQYAGKQCVRLSSTDTLNPSVLGFQREIPIPDMVDTITISFKLNKDLKGNDKFYFVTHSMDLPEGDNVICDEQLNVEGGEGWQDYQIQFKNTSEINSFFFRLVSIDSVNFLLDDFDVLFDDIPISEFHFYTSENIQLLNKYAKTINNVSLKESVDDLSFLSDIVNDKTVVGLGESNHGQREFIRMKSRLIKYMVENEGFNTIVFESHMDNLYHVNEYVTNENSKLDIDSVMNQFIHVFRKEEIKTLVNWIKDYNANKPKDEKVYFLGCDMQDDFQSTLHLKSFAASKDTVLLRLLKEYEEEYKVYENLAIIKQIQAHIKAQESKYDIEEIELKRLKQSSFILEQFAIFDANLGNRSIHRDSSMANNLLWILNTYKDRKAIFWADNYHTNIYPVISAGGYLASALKEKYYVIDFYVSKGFSVGKFAKTSILSTLMPPNPEYYLNAVPHDVFFLDSSKFCEEFNDQEKHFKSMQGMCEAGEYNAVVHIKVGSPAIELN